MERALTNSTIKKLRHDLVCRRVLDWLKDRGIAVGGKEERNEAEGTDAELHLAGEYRIKGCKVVRKVFIQIGDGYFCAVGRHADGFLFMDTDDKMPLEEQLRRAYHFALTGKVQE